MATADSHRGQAYAGYVLHSPRLAVRGGDDSYTNQRKRPRKQHSQTPLQPRLRRFLHTCRRLCRRPALPCRGSETSQRDAANTAQLPARAAIRAHRRQTTRIQRLRESRKRVVGTIPHQVQRPYKAERGIYRLRHRAGSKGAQTYDALRPQQGIPRPGILRHRQPLPLARRHRQGNRELHNSQRKIDTIRNRQSHKPAAPRRPVLHPPKIRARAALLLRGRAAAARNISGL